jgi:hypothetical protein
VARGGIDGEWTGGGEKMGKNAGAEFEPPGPGPDRDDPPPFEANGTDAGRH